jgi:beta-galactosidase
VPRQVNSNGRIQRYRIEVSDDGSVWREVANGHLPDREAPSVIDFSDEQTVRYLRCVALSSYHGPWASMAEMNPIVVGRRVPPIQQGLPD